MVSSAMTAGGTITSPIGPHPHLTRFHELAHVLLVHTPAGAPHGDELIPRNLQECEAEVVAMLCCVALDLPGVEFSDRAIQHWSGSGKIPRRSAQWILKAVDQIVKAGDEAATPPTIMPTTPPTTPPAHALALAA